MAKRFTDTEKWEHGWFTEAGIVHKLIWFYLCDNCDGVGIWKVNFKLASFVIGHEIGWDDLQKIGLGERIVRLSDDKVWIPGFIKFQYKSLNPKNSAHRGMMKTIIQAVAGLPLTGESKELVESFIQLLKDPHLSLDRGSNDPTGKVKGKGIGKDNEGGVGEDEPIDLDGSAADIDWIQEAEWCFKAARRFKKSNSAALRWLNEWRTAYIEELGGFDFIRELKPTSYEVRRLSKLIQEAAGEIQKKSTATVLSADVKSVGILTEQFGYESKEGA
jgi:hypothetical protein